MASINTGYAEQYYDEMTDLTATKPRLPAVLHD